MKIIFLSLMLLMSTTLYAGSISIEYPNGEAARIVEGLTNNNHSCLQGETSLVCVKRLLAFYVKSQVRQYENQKAIASATLSVNDTNPS